MAEDDVTGRRGEPVLLPGRDAQAVPGEQDVMGEDRAQAALARYGLPCASPAGHAA